ncbi:hypothetical protein G3V96_30550, partial [Escherichia coli]|nr:hypothetical protein [Escherichia coli]
IGLAMFMAGSGFQSWSHKGFFEAQQHSFDAKETAYRARLRELNDYIKNELPKICINAKSVEDTKSSLEQVQKKLDELPSKIGESNGKDFSKESGE